MSLMMYRDGVLSADRRMLNPATGEETYDGLELYSKLFLSPDKTFLVGVVGYVASQKDLMTLKTRLDMIIQNQDKSKEDWPISFVKSTEAEEFFKNDSTLFLFYAGRFLIVKQDYGADLKPGYLECDLNKCRTSGNGTPAATVLLRSGKPFTLKRFYRIVAATTDSVTTAFDEIAVNQVKGFSI